MLLVHHTQIVVDMKFNEFPVIIENLKNISSFFVVSFLFIKSSRQSDQSRKSQRGFFFIVITFFITHHPQINGMSKGSCIVWLKEKNTLNKVIKALNGRYVDGRQIGCKVYNPDGDYIASEIDPEARGININKLLLQ
mmetsp:Transcript_44441/g.74140  ORF Transcript_44441/g.74140 Transcript_44441/m.74140 type:complete len:137 (+) Transcript_44441:2117-2527(+)